MAFTVMTWDMENLFGRAPRRRPIIDVYRPTSEGLPR
jgi:hypothetical protein